MNKSPIILILVVSLAVGCAKSDWIERTLVTVDVTGTWENTEGSQLKLQLEQRGAKVRGSMVRWAMPMGSAISGGIEGSVAGDVFRFQQISGLQSCVGEFTVNGDDMSGGMDCGRPSINKRVLHRVDSSAPPPSQ